MKKFEMSMDIPEMPDDFWPESVVINVTHGQFALGAAVANKADVKDAIEGLRLSFWHAIHSKETEGAD